MNVASCWSIELVHLYLPSIPILWDDMIDIVVIIVVSINQSSGPIHLVFFKIWLLNANLRFVLSPIVDYPIIVVISNRWFRLLLAA